MSTYTARGVRAGRISCESSRPPRPPGEGAPRRCVASYPLARPAKARLANKPRVLFWLKSTSTRRRDESLCSGGRPTDSRGERTRTLAREHDVILVLVHAQLAARRHPRRRGRGRGRHAAPGERRREARAGRHKERPRRPRAGGSTRNHRRSDACRSNHDAVAVRSPQSRLDSSRENFWRNSVTTMTNCSF